MPAIACLALPANGCLLHILPAACRWRDVAPEDKDLRRYRDWLEQTGGLGTGLSRHRTMQTEGGAGGEGGAA